MKATTSVAAVSLLSMLDSAQALMTLPLKPINKDLASSVRQSTRPNSALGPISVPVKDWIKHGADLQWYTEIEVGTPPQKFNVIFDTGSFDMFIADKNCTDCSNSRTFDSSKSSTFNSQPGTPGSFQYGTGVDSTPLPNGGDGVSGRYVTDKVGIAGRSVAEQQFLLCDDYPHFMDDVPFDGVMGIGQDPGATDLPSGSPWYFALYNAGQIPSLEIALYYPEGQKDGAEMTIGGINPDRYTGDFHKVALGEGNSNYVVGTTDLIVNGKSIPAPNGGTYSYTILDSGTAYFAASDPIVTALYKSISPKIKKLNHEAWGVECSVVDSLAAEIAFTFGDENGSFNATMPKESFNLGPYEGKPGICQTVFSTIEFERNGFLIGAPLLKQYYTVWNAGDHTMSFAELKKN